MLSYVTDHIPKTTPYNRRPGYSMTPEYITIHSTGNPTSTARNERAWLTNPNNNVTASWHIVVDEKEAIEAIPLNEVAWHAGDGGNGTGNRKSIGIEICESGDRQKTLKNAAELVAKLLKERGWGVDSCAGIMTGAVKYALGFSTITASGQGGNSLRKLFKRNFPEVIT
ncbi:peptidoglycan recognition protein family protein [Thermoclostridium stercorarium]|uniref:peptidoglycan recognition protein family protein n=1 Tax=Thermoclostridium stercorarium TaxID=1510 RepID=UPI0020931AC3|nr:N-acetylmuramoyl-L-alanine amidase [Thermoclostridium stercorarium]